MLVVLAIGGHVPASGALQRTDGARLFVECHSQICGHPLTDEALGRSFHVASQILQAHAVLLSVVVEGRQGRDGVFAIEGLQALDQSGIRG